MKMKKIIWATDGSSEAQEALKYAVYIAKEFSAEITGIYVSTNKIKSIYSELYLSKQELFNNLEESEERNFEKSFSKIESRLGSKGIHFTGKVLRGEAASRIVSFVQKENADLVVIGVRGHGLLDKMLLGSTTLKILKKSKTSVLSFKKREKKRLGIKNILVPVDVFEREGSALEYAADLASVIKARIYVVYSIRMEGHIYALPSLLNELVKRSSLEIIKRVEELKLRRRLKGKNADDLRISTKVVHGINPTMAITDYASSKNIDLIVINSHSRSGIKKLILGSTTENIIQYSQCSTLVVRP
jgi:nucleotide-binding universal stress UspA family protein